MDFEAYCIGDNNILSEKVLDVYLNRETYLNWERDRLWSFCLKWRPEILYNLIWLKTRVDFDLDFLSERTFDFQIFDM